MKVSERLKPLKGTVEFLFFQGFWPQIQVQQLEHESGLSDNADFSGQ